jgi:hypothetical protein
MADSSGWLIRNRTFLYPIANLAVATAAVMRTSSGDMTSGAAIYLAVLFALCTAPLLLLKRFNDRYAVLAVFMGLYFLWFGGLDLQTALLGLGDRIPPQRPGFMTSAELAILVGCGCALIGYLFGARSGDLQEQRRRKALAEWPAPLLFLMGVVIWALGTLSVVYFQIVIMPSKLGGMAETGPLTTFALMLGHLMQPLGTLMLAYGYAKFRTPLWYGLIMVVVILQVAVGFVMDMKQEAMMGGILVIMACTVVTNKLPKGWLAGTAVCVVIAFPIFQAYRVEVTNNRGLDRAQALSRIDKVLEVVMAAKDKDSEGSHRAETFLERASSKINMEILFEHVGFDAPLLHGRTLIGIPMAFVPRILVPDKEDVSVGLLFGQQILHADSGVFISISHLGELYWNFGWPGIVLGMTAIGALLGFIGARFTMEREVTLTRVLVLLGTIQLLCLGFGGTMPVSYIQWMRAMAAIGLMHLFFARSSVKPHIVDPPADNVLQAANALALPAGPRFPNIMR